MQPNSRTKPYDVLQVVLALIAFSLLVGLCLYVCNWLGPQWVLAIIVCLCAIYLPTHFRLRHVKQSQILEEAGHCGTCGYDLRESFEGCQECGAPIPEPLARRRRLRSHPVQQ